ncbi:hypothetical protein AVEN_164305-1, partial [Araneus ventricosus]
MVAKVACHSLPSNTNS